MEKLPNFYELRGIRVIRQTRIFAKPVEAPLLGLSFNPFHYSSKTRYFKTARNVA